MSLFSLTFSINKRSSMNWKDSFEYFETVKYDTVTVYTFSISRALMTWRYCFKYFYNSQVSLFSLTFSINSPSMNLEIFLKMFWNSQIWHCHCSLTFSISSALMIWKYCCKYFKIVKCPLTNSIDSPSVNWKYCFEYFEMVIVTISLTCCLWIVVHRWI
jgi:hypothetical protein